ncbi:uncharacterized protein BCR38DRAFT_121460 [Pseudomassariella vexata]|uniref:Uncharacterized protein n=1 Tax=Pseudomassariella vexata TaxID=1141098 RepID=A0A1Y2D9B4_9PEZI|nr:uncharacterized protein BCR38DRAFT_121460 [Pseudomassariella vexata]ORY55860.1 hypothetical protein BCR38DRAFT_121460 [Pseudomassariella vexata]
MAMVSAQDNSAAVASAGKESTKPEAPGKISGDLPVNTRPESAVLATTSTGPVPSGTTATSTSASVKADPYSTGPSPEKGSGQDRFRQMMAQAPNFPKGSSAYTDLDTHKSENSTPNVLVGPLSGSAATPEKKTVRFATESASDKDTDKGQCHQSLSSVPGLSNHIRPSSTGPFAQSNTIMPYAAAMSMGHAQYSPYYSNMMPQPHDDPRIAINPAIFPYAVDVSRTSDLSSASVANDATDVNSAGYSKGGGGGGGGGSGSRVASGTAASGNRATNINAGRTGGTNGNGNGDNWTPTWTSILSAECQKRRFNPQFSEWQTPDGAFHASVNVNGFIVHDSRNFKSASEAKQTLAKRALAHVRKTPAPKQSNGAAEKLKHDLLQQKQQQQNAGRDGSGSVPAKIKVEAGYDHYAGASATRRDAPRDAIRDQSAGNVGTPDQDRRLLERVQAMYGRSQPSHRMYSDPVAARAFLEGFALGGRLRENARPLNEGERRRSRSPRAGYEWDGRARFPHERSPQTPTSRYYRERSPSMFIHRRDSLDGRIRYQG